MSHENNLSPTPHHTGFVALSVGLACLCWGANAQVGLAAGSQDRIYHYMEEVNPSPVMELPSLDPLPPAVDAPEIMSDIIDPAMIINIVKNIWDVVKDNRPVANVASDFAQALPKGVASPADLAGFTDLQSHTYHLYGKNMFGMTVYDLYYTTVHQYGGSYDGKGHYLATVSVVPSKVVVKSGYKLDLKVTQVSVVNVGSTKDPIASLAMEMSLSVSSMIQHSITKTIYQFRGDSEQVKVIGAPGTPGM